MAEIIFTRQAREADAKRHEEERKTPKLMIYNLVNDRLVLGSHSLNSHAEIFEKHFGMRIEKGDVPSGFFRCWEEQDEGRIQVVAKPAAMKHLNKLARALEEAGYGEYSLCDNEKVQEVGLVREIAVKTLAERARDFFARWKNK